ncbi:MAG: pyrroline-5-carboxylate reductase [Bacteroidales bacterium]|nr:MAG: pyrroline-5-carboxylate reductase [Bacteroidales bacterium]
MKISIIGGGNIGLSFARGLVYSGKYKSSQITITRRSEEALNRIKDEGFIVTTDNVVAISNSSIIVLSVLPQHLNRVLKEIAPAIDSDKHLIISIVTGVTIQALESSLGSRVAIVRAMPNTAISIQQSMTCILGNHNAKPQISKVKEMFDLVGQTIEIKEELMSSATALCACGTAFFLRAIRAASQGGVEIGFHSDEALRMAAQTAKGAAALLLELNSHPEQEIDKVTSPKGCTIAGLNEMEHHGFSSSLILGIKTSAVKADNLYKIE